MGQGEFDSVLRHLRNLDTVAVDIETTGFYPWNGDVVRGVSIAADGWAVYVPVSHPNSENVTEEQYAELLAVLSGMEMLVFHNALFDLSFLHKYGLRTSWSA